MYRDTTQHYEKNKQKHKLQYWSVCIVAVNVSTDIHDAQTKAHTL